MPAGDGPFLVAAGEGEQVTFGGFAVTFKVAGSATAGAFSVVEYLVHPRTLIFPHVHEREDELSYVVSGEIGVRVGDDEMIAGTGSYVRKPRKLPHTFWNRTDEPARVVEIISPAGFEQYFRETTPLFTETGEPDFAVIAAMKERYGNGGDVGQADWIPDLMHRYGLHPPA